MRVHDFIRGRVPRVERDRSIAPDLRLISDMIVAGDLERATGVVVN